MMNTIMVLKGGSPAIHKLGDIGRKEDDFIRVMNEDKDYYIGQFEIGFGFINVKFNKSDCRNLTQEEIDHFNDSYFSINNNPMARYHVDGEGNIIPNQIKT